MENNNENNENKTSQNTSEEKKPRRDRPERPKRAGNPHRRQQNNNQAVNVNELDLVP